MSSPPRVTRVGLGTPKVIATGLTDAVQAWSPGPGTVNTSTGSRDYSGIVKGYTGTDSLALANAEIGTGIYGQIFADTADCLADATGERPYFGTPLDDPDVPAAVPESDSSSPSGARSPASTTTSRPAAGWPSPRTKRPLTVLASCGSGCTHSRENHHPRRRLMVLLYSWDSPCRSSGSRARKRWRPERHGYCHRRQLHRGHHVGFRVHDRSSGISSVDSASLCRRSSIRGGGGANPASASGS